MWKAILVIAGITLAATAAKAADDLRAPLFQKPEMSDADVKRVTEMRRLLHTSEKDAYAKFKKLCSQATERPAVGMTEFRALGTTWCWPTGGHTTTTARGVTRQDTFAGGRALYFENGILTMIQE